MPFATTADSRSVHGRPPRKIVASPINMHDTPKKIRRPTPDAGEHTDEILHSFGYTDAQLKELRASGAIA